MKVEDKKQLKKSPELHGIKGYINTSDYEFKNLICLFSSGISLA